MVSTRQQGAALILVLWALAVLSLLAANVVASVRLENRQGHNELERSKAQLAAQGGLALAVQLLLGEPGRLPADGRRQVFDLDGTRLTLSVRSEHGKLDLNFCQPELFARLLTHLGADPQRAALHARQLQQHRTQGKPLRHLEELLQVTTLTTEHYQRVLPFITLWGGDGVPVATYAAPTLRKALGLKAASAVVSNPGSMLSIDSQAELGNGTTAGVLTTVVLNPGDGDGTLYRVLRWQER